MLPILSKEETLSMRGVAITFIVLHNLLHQKMPTLENEFSFSLSRTINFGKHMLDLDSTTLLDIFSFMGWYGVPVFIFLSGYGLASKYSFATISPFTPKKFVWKHIKSVFFLMIIPYIPFVSEQISNYGYIKTLFQTLLVGNIFCPNSIHPGVFWFFGLILQFYILFAILRYIPNIHHRKRALISLNILSLLILFCLSSNMTVLNIVRHNFIGWLLPFSMGIWFAQNNGLNNLFNYRWKNASWIFVAGILTTVSNFNFYTWILSSGIVIMAAIGLTKILVYNSLINKLCVWFGTISAFLFATHPFVRHICMTRFCEEMSRPSYILGYFFVSIAAALLYRLIHKRLFSSLI